MAWDLAHPPTLLLRYTRLLLAEPLRRQMHGLDRNNEGGRANGSGQGHVGLMRQIAAERRLPEDLDAQPVVRAAAALQPVIRSHHDEIEREPRLPKALVEQFRAAGFYSLVIPRELGGLQVDPLTYLRVRISRLSVQPVGQWCLRDRLGTSGDERDGHELQSRRFYLDVAPCQCHAFSVTKIA